MDRLKQKKSQKSAYGDEVAAWDGWNKAGWPYRWPEGSLEDVTQRWKSNPKGHWGAVDPAQTEQLEPHHCKFYSNHISAV